MQMNNKTNNIIKKDMSPSWRFHYIGAYTAKTIGYAPAAEKKITTIDIEITKQRKYIREIFIILLYGQCKRWLWCGINIYIINFVFLCSLIYFLHHFTFISRLFSSDLIYIFLHNVWKSFIEWPDSLISLMGSKSIEKEQELQDN